MRNVYVQTSNSKAFAAKLASLNERGAGEACLMVVDGEPGLSKSRTALWFAVQQGAALVRAKKGWTPRWMLADILAAVTKEPPAYAYSDRYRQVVAKLAQESLVAARERRTFAVIIDEADSISASREMLKTIQDISDMVEIPIILIGMGRIGHNLLRVPEVASRVGARVEFLPLTLEDTEAMVKGLAEVEVAPELIEFLHRASKGYAREVKEGIAVIERFGKRNPGPVTLAAMKDKVLLTDRATGKEIKVEA